MNKKAFTLIELLAVIVILAILMAIAVPKILTTIETSRKNSLVSSTKILAKLIQSDSILNDKAYYKLDSDGKLYRCNDGGTCSNTKEIKYNGKLVAFSNDSIILVKNTDGTVELQTGGKICDKTKNNCISATNSAVSLKSVKIDDVAPGSVSSTTQSNTTTTTTPIDQNTVVASGDISGDGGYVAFELKGSGILTITGFGPTKSSDSDGAPWDRIAAKIIADMAKDDIDISFENISPIASQFGIPTEMAIQYMYYTLAQMYSSRAASVEEFDSYIFAKYEWHPQIWGSGSTAEEGINDVQTLLIMLYGEANMNKIWNYIHVDEVVFSNGITEIGANCFRDLGTTSIELSNTITEIGHSAFAENQLKDLVIPNNVTTIWRSAFSLSNIENITLGNSLTYIGDYAFVGNKIKILEIPASVGHLGWGAFANNPFTSVTILANENNIVTRFNENWENIGFPTLMMP